MAIIYLSGNRIQGLSSDTKPTLVPDNSIFFETDTAVQFQFTGSTWDVFGGGSVTIPSSENSTPFSNASRPDTTDETVLLDMEDFSDLDIFIEQISYTGPTQSVGGSLVVDGDLSTIGSQLLCPDDGSFIDFAHVDFGTLATRTPKAKIRKFLASSSREFTATLEVSNDDSAWSTVDTSVIDTPTAVDRELTGTSQSFRHMRMRAQWTGGFAATSNFAAYELYNGDIFGGTVDVSVELQNGETALWQEIVSAADIGTSTTDNEVHGHVGKNAVDVAGAEKNYNLPKTTTGLRLRLVVNGGGATTSCSIIKSGFQG